MKHLFFIALLFTSFCAKAQSNTTRIEVLEKKATWAKGRIIWLEKEKSVDSLKIIRLTNENISLKQMVIDNMQTQNKNVGYVLGEIGKFKPTWFDPQYFSVTNGAGQDSVTLLKPLTVFGSYSTKPVGIISINENTPVIRQYLDVGDKVNLVPSLPIGNPQ